MLVERLPSSWELLDSGATGVTSSATFCCHISLKLEKRLMHQERDLLVFKEYSDNLRH